MTLAVRSMFLRALIVALVAVPMAASAQIMTPAIPLPGEEPNDSWAKLSYAHVFKTDIEDLSNAQLQRESVLLLLGRRFGEPESKLKFAGQFAYQLSAYNFFNDNLATLGSNPNRGGLLNSNSPRSDLQCGPAGVPSGCGGNLWSDIHQFTFLGMATYQLDDGWTLLGGGLFRLAGESGADMSEAINGGGFVGFNYKWTDDLSVGALVGVVSQIEGSASILPLPLVKWHFADEWNFNLGVHQLGGVGYGPELSWKPSEEWDFSLIASYERRRYRLANRNSTKNFVGDETSLPIILQAAFHPTSDIEIGGFVGMVMAGNIRMETQNGHRVFDKSYKPSPTVGLNSTFRF